MRLGFSLGLTFEGAVDAGNSLEESHRKWGRPIPIYAAEARLVWMPERTSSTLRSTGCVTRYVLHRLAQDALTRRELLICPQQAQESDSVVREVTGK